MNLIYKPDFDRAKEYWRAYWEKEIIDRPCVCIKAPKGRNLKEEPPRDLITSYPSADAMIDKFEKWANSTYFAGEAIPFLYATLGPDQFSSFFGTELFMAEDFSTAWAKPWVTSWSDVDIKLKVEKGSTFNRINEFIKYAAERSEGKYLISMIDLHSNMDCLSAMRGPEMLCMDLVDCPEEIDRAMLKVRSYYKTVYESIYISGKMDSRGSIGFASFYSEGKFAVIQCDFLCMLSPEHARKYVIPALEEEAAYLDHCVFHYDGKEALRHLDDILSIKEIDVIQWVPGAGQPRTIEWIDLLKKMQKAGKGLHLYDWTVEEIKYCCKERILRPEGLMFEVQVDSTGEAEELLEFLLKNT